MKSYKLRFVFVIATGFIVFVAAHFYRAVVVSLDAEKTLHAFHLVVDVLEAYLLANSGKWPTSWDDLARISPHEQSSIFHWPEDIPELRKRIRINFDLTTAQVASMNVDHFTAVEQIGPNYGPREPHIHRLLYVARKSIR